MRYYILRAKDGWWFQRVTANDRTEHPAFVEERKNATAFNDRDAAQVALAELQSKVRVRCEVVPESSEDEPIVDLSMLSRAHLIAALDKIREAYTPESKTRVACGDVRWFIDHTLANITHAVAHAKEAQLHAHQEEAAQLLVAAEPKVGDVWACMEYQTQPTRGRHAAMLRRENGGVMPEFKPGPPRLGRLDRIEPDGRFLVINPETGRKSRVQPDTLRAAWKLVERDGKKIV